MESPDPDRVLQGIALYVILDKVAARLVADTGGSQLSALADIRAASEQAIKLQVTRERVMGRSWADVGGDLGVSPQAAQQRYGRRPVR